MTNILGIKKFLALKSEELDGFPQDTHMHRFKHLKQPRYVLFAKWTQNIHFPGITQEVIVSKFKQINLNFISNQLS